VVIGFGTSAPELLVSVMAALQGNPGIALGNAYGSNISNIALILGVSALVSPIVVQSKVLKKELPLLLGATVLAATQLVDGHLSRWDAIVLLGVFVGLMLWSVIGGFQTREDVLSGEVDERLSEKSLSGLKAWIHLLVGLLVLIASSRVRVWGAVGIAHRIGVSDLMIGLTVVAVGTSLPELASSVVAVRKGEYDLAIGNVIGSNLFNTLAVVGLAAVLHPMDVSPEVLRRDVVVMTGLTVLLLVLGVGLRGRQGRINRFEGGMLVCSYCAYIGYLVYVTFAGGAPG
jgi:cation:H+ antiporter